MRKETLDSYIRHVEKKITPEKVAITFQGGMMLKKLPLFIQRRIADKGATIDPYMGFVVDPYALFLAYEVNQELVADYLGTEYELEPTSLFADTDKKPCAILGCFNIHTSVFQGSRFELYVIARNKKTGLASWIICNYESNTINYDPGHGFVGPTLEHCVYTTTFNGDIVCDVKSLKGDQRLDLDVNIENRKRAELDQTLWIEGNLSVDYSGDMDNADGDPFGLIFDPGEMQSALVIPVQDLAIRKLRFGFLNESLEPFEACVFPYAQHFITTTFPAGHELKTKDDLDRKIESILAEAAAGKTSGRRRLE